MAETASENGDGAPVRREGRLMGGGVDASGQAAVDCEPRVGELVAELFGSLGGVVARLPCPDDADAVPLIARLQLPEDVEDDRRVMDFLQQFRILGIALGENPRSGLFHPGQFGIEIRVFLP